MSVSQFARKIGMNQKTVDFYMKGQRKPSVELIFSVCSSCNVSADWLLGLDDNATSPVQPSRGATKTVEESAKSISQDCRDCPTVKELASALARFLDEHSSKPGKGTKNTKAQSPVKPNK